MRVPSSRVLVGVVALAVAGAVLALWPRREPTPRELLERKVVQMTRAAEEKDLGEVMEHVSERFKSAEGLDKQGLRGILAGQLLRGGWVRVFVTDLAIAVTSDRHAALDATFIFARSDAKTLQELAKESVLSRYRVQSKVEKETDGQWRFVSARYQRQ
ncbi:MAG: hypothetical protein ACOZIN_16555 [Myxococcota bacterium]